MADTQTDRLRPVIVDEIDALQLEQAQQAAQDAIDERLLYDSDEERTQTDNDDYSAMPPLSPPPPPPPEEDNDDNSKKRHTPDDDDDVIVLDRRPAKRPRLPKFFVMIKDHGVEDVPFLHLLFSLPPHCLPLDRSEWDRELDLETRRSLAAAVRRNDNAKFVGCGPYADVWANVCADGNSVVLTLDVTE
jgi:hypothetical protein